MHTKWKGTERPANNILPTERVVSIKWLIRTTHIVSYKDLKYFCKYDFFKLGNSFNTVKIVGKCNIASSKHCANKIASMSSIRSIYFVANLLFAQKVCGKPTFPMMNCENHTSGRTRQISHTQIYCSIIENARSCEFFVSNTATIIKTNIFK